MGARRSAWSLRAARFARRSRCANRLRDQALRLAPYGSTRQRRRPLADRTGAQHVIAEELKLVPQALFQFGQLRVALIL